MSATLTVDDREFNDAVEACLANTRREASVALNSRALAVCKKAIDSTEKADPAKIEYVMGRIGTSFKRNKKGRIIKKSRTAIYRENSFAENIIRSRDKKAGNAPKTDAEMLTAIKRLIAGRKSSASFIRGGWADAAVSLAQKIGLATRKRFGRGKLKGEGVAATKEADVKSTSVTNTALLAESNYGSKGDPMRVAVPALQRAMDRETKEMLDHLTKKLQDSLNKNSARKA